MTPSASSSRNLSVSMRPVAFGVRGTSFAEVLRPPSTWRTVAAASPQEVGGTPAAPPSADEMPPQAGAGAAALLTPSGD
jgi:hypothetical protein